MADVVALRRADLELARRSVRGDEAANEAIFDAHHRRVHRVLFRVLGSNRDMDDLVQDAFIEIFTSLAGYRGDAQLSTWVDRVTVRVALRALRDRRTQGTRLELVESHAVEDPSAAPDRRLMMRQAARRLYALLDGVSVESRTAFLLHVVDGRSLEEVAALTGATRVATKLRVWRTRQRIEASARRDPLLAHFVEGAARATVTGEGGR